MSKSVYSREYRLFLDHLRMARKRSGLTQREVAHQLERSQSFVAKCERGENRVDVAQLVEFCRVLKIPLVEFMTRYNTALESDAADNGEPDNGAFQNGDSDNNAPKGES